MNEIEQKFPVVIEIPIVWGHMDAFNHVNNVMFFRFFESARIAYFDKIDFMEMRKHNGIGPILASASCKYINPLFYPDMISIGVKITQLEEDQFIMEYSIYSQNTGQIVAVGDSKVVCFDYHNDKRVKIPKSLKQKIKEIEGSIL